VQSLLTGGK
jgi:hypothetical protein